MKHHSVSSSQKAMEIIKLASQKKAVGATRMNDTSSRSHTIVVLNISQTDQVKHDTRINSQVFLVDLAGSERVEKTGAAGDRLKEAQNINLSLTLLGNVISKLTDGKSLHIPYRDAKLTRLLQDSIGGNAMTTLICTGSEEKQHLQETLSTLQFAQRAKSIKNQPVANIVRGIEEVTKELATAMMEVKPLRRKLQLLEMGANPTSNSVADDQTNIQSILLEIEQLREELAASQKENADLKEIIQFHKRLELNAKNDLAALQISAAQDRASAEAATEKLTELLKCFGSSNDSNTKETKELFRGGITKSTATAMKGSPKPPPQRRSNSTLGLRSAPEIQAMTKPTAPEVFEPNSMSLIKSEAQAIVRERMLLAQIDVLKKDLDDHKKFAILVDHERADNVELRHKHQRETDDLVTRYEKMLSGQDEQISGLTVEIAKEKESNEALLLQIKKLKSEVEEMVSVSQMKTDATLTEDQSKSELKKITDERARQWILRLEAENKELHTENRLNGMRMSDLTKRVDETQSENKQLQDDRDAMRRHIELHTMEDGVLKTKLLKLLTKSEKDKQQERSYFRKRLLDCFSSE
eukprot:GILI01021450.1.p1 GENE.GILI01021450.1~~GILI01021450.1.p1  ORF type:complete len:601 (+),score=80.57 GILI01021450.1:58-1803(+)